MKITKNDDGSINVEGEIKYKGLQALRSLGTIEKVSFSKLKFLPAKHVADLVEFKEIRELWI
ncbi:hypothetical protein H0A36_15220 [Endozoicomonas sp. SM1973]|uniref:Uncharacterized protein n=1 Tax=Spartinivicinus marinus TaxID=2994442 RepID=A0A853ICX3_9GAMM|nr:hypothetical protein [Spartinivicinus marinus]MCX4026220.1 hypothetical protein [Spartinivicinus marinus]NYZ67367.1 hypothetical protein [Spartinivicinus marinus]